MLQPGRVLIKIAVKGTISIPIQQPLRPTVLKLVRASLLNELPQCKQVTAKGLENGIVWMEKLAPVHPVVVLGEDRLDQLGSEVDIVELPLPREVNAKDSLVLGGG